MITPWLFDIFNYPWSTDARKFDTEGCQDLYDWHFDSWVLAEEAGFEGIFFSEHHYTPYSVSPSPNLLVAALAKRTSRMRLGVMANIVPMHNPRRLAEEFAMLDYLTNGRLEVGLGRGIDEREYAREGIPMEETRPRFEEGLKLIEKMTADAVFTHSGKYADFQQTSMWPQALPGRSAPWITATSPATVAWCAENGYRISTAFQPTTKLRQAHDTYRAAAKKAGNPSGSDTVMALRNVFVADTDEEARAIAEPALNHMFGLFKESVVFSDLDNIPEGYSSEFYESFFRPFAGSGPVDWQTLVDLGIFIVGSPSTVRESLIKQAHELGTSNILMWGSFGTLTKEQTLHSYNLLGQEVIPALRDETVA
ncbi:LLM class flavin-dependent oxidoreductase [Streptomyces sp. NBC_00690]|uniref:LLM class flavin-dependent oxidoreductase n=1 Tax=Streptomyces sp. NBC_00690 TaxID=2975808 RepID=UPI002E2DF0EE|nr:LLM class flavin-dependent oxidoreductase [Streptomyces sp. NBC_00690]